MVVEEDLIRDKIFEGEGEIVYIDRSRKIVLPERYRILVRGRNVAANLPERFLSVVAMTFVGDKYICHPYSDFRDLPQFIPVTENEVNGEILFYSLTQMKKIDGNGRIGVPDFLKGSSRFFLEPSGNHFSLEKG